MNHGIWSIYFPLGSCYFLNFLLSYVPETMHIWNRTAQCGFGLEVHPISLCTISCLMVSKPAAAVPLFNLQVTNWSGSAPHRCVPTHTHQAGIVEPVEREKHRWLEWGDPQCVQAQTKRGSFCLLVGASEADGLCPPFLPPYFHTRRDKQRKCISPSLIYIYTIKV